MNDPDGPLFPHKATDPGCLFGFGIGVISVVFALLAIEAIASMLGHS